jgi:hypothetical protein
MSTKRSKVITVAAAGALTVAAAASVAAGFPSSSAPMPASADALLSTVSQQAAAAHVTARASQSVTANGRPQPLADKWRIYENGRIKLQFTEQKPTAVKNAPRKAAAGQVTAADKTAQQAPVPQAQPAQVVAVTTPSGSPEQIAEQMLGQFGWSTSQFSCLQPLWQQESGWNVSAENPSSGAYGIPQALPGSEMASAGADWQTDAATQIRWGLTYIQGRYGSPCGAWAHEEADGWY